MNLIKKDIILSKSAGFCYGVKRAVDLSIKIKEENPNTAVYIYGQLIHNTQVIERLEQLDIKTLNEIPQDKQIDGICIIRTHGAKPQDVGLLEQKGLKIIDATCPDVKRVQNKAKELSESGYQVIIIGKADHPEVIAIKAYADLNSECEAIVVSSREEAIKHSDDIKKAKKVGIVVQTTQKIENFKQIIPVIVENTKEAKIYNTICAATSNRQDEAMQIANNVDLMIVVGSKSSANTTHLAEVLGVITKTVHIETSEELKDIENLLENSSKIGVTAGASTPDFIIDEAMNFLKEKY